MIVIFEGICGSGKTTLCKAWKRMMVEQQRRGFYFFNEKYEKTCPQLGEFYQCEDKQTASRLFVEIQEWIFRTLRNQIRNVHDLLQEGCKLVVMDRSIFGCKSFIDHALWCDLINAETHQRLLYAMSNIDDFWAFMLGHVPTVIVHMDCEEEDNISRIGSRNYPINNKVYGLALDREKQQYIRKELKKSLEKHVASVITKSFVMVLNSSACSVNEAVEMVDYVVKEAQVDDRMAMFLKIMQHSFVVSIHCLENKNIH